MNILRRIFSSWQGWSAGLVAISIYFVSPTIIRSLIDPTAGQTGPAMDAGLLQIIALSAVIYFTMAALVWLWWQIAFRSLDRLYDEGIESLYRKIPPWLAVLLIQGSFVFATFCWMWAMKVALYLNEVTVAPRM